MVPLGILTMALFWGHWKCLLIVHFLVRFTDLLLNAFLVLFMCFSINRLKIPFREFCLLVLLINQCIFIVLKTHLKTLYLPPLFWLLPCLHLVQHFSIYFSFRDVTAHIGSELHLQKYFTASFWWKHLQLHQAFLGHIIYYSLSSKMFVFELVGG